MVSRLFQKTCYARYMKKAPVLIIEDDENIRELYGDALTMGGIDVLKAKNGKEGLKMALEHHPSVILVDLMMPEMDGHETVKKIRNDDWGKDARVIYLTNMTDAKNVVNAVEQRPEEYIVKSHTEVKEVVNKVRTAMYT